MFCAIHRSMEWLGLWTIGPFVLPSFETSHNIQWKVYPLLIPAPGSVACCCPWYWEETDWEDANSTTTHGWVPEQFSCSSFSRKCSPGLFRSERTNPSLKTTQSFSVRPFVSKWEAQIEICHSWKKAAGSRGSAADSNPSHYNAEHNTDYD